MSSIQSPFSKFVLIVYPVVTSIGNDNMGGFSHLKGNIEVYKRLGFRVACLCRFHPKIIQIKNGVYFFNLIPGRSEPKAELSQYAGVGHNKNFDLVRRSLIRVRALSSILVLKALMFLFRPAVVHQRANGRIMAPRLIAKAKYLLELNDEFECNANSDAFLSVLPREHINLPSLINPWPVVGGDYIDAERLKMKFCNISSKKSLQIVLFGFGGIDDIEEVTEFLSDHAWLRYRDYKLCIYGAKGKNFGNVVFKGFVDDSTAKLEKYDIGLIFYSKKIYSDARILQGDPSKFYKYVDANLPIISNREYVSSYYLNNMDLSTLVFESDNLLEKSIQNMIMRRKSASISFYAHRLGELLKLLHCQVEEVPSI